MSFVKRNYIDGETVITAENLNDIQDAIIQIVPDEVKQALLQIASKVAYIDEHGQDYYDALESALYPDASLVSISAVYTQSGTVYDTDSLDSLKADLVVTAHYDDSTTATVTAYTLSGTLAVGTSTITVVYGGKAATFSVEVTKDTTAVVEYSGYCLEHKNNPSRVERTARTYCGVTKPYNLDSASTALDMSGVIPYSGTSLTSGYCCLVINNNGTYVNYVDERTNAATRWAQPANGATSEYRQNWTVSEYNQVLFTVDIRHLDDAYMYHTVTGQVFFAGKNTPYFGMSNISEAQ